MSAASRPSSLTVTDVQLLVEKLNSDLSGLAFDRAIVPDRPEFPEGFLKGEWSLRFRSRQAELALLVSLRPQNVFFAWEKGKGPRASEKGTRSGFDLALNKILDGLKVSSIEQRPGDRVVTLWFSAGDQARKYGLVLQLFPALPEAVLVENEGAEDYPVLARMRAGNEKETRFRYPEVAPQPLEAKLQRDAKRTLPEDLGQWPRIVREWRRQEALNLRRSRLGREVRALRKNNEKRIAQQQTAEASAGKEPDYAHYGDLLKSVLGAQEPPLDSTNHRAVVDWSTEAEVRIPCDPKLTAIQQVKKFYELAKRKQRRLSEASSRAEEFSRRQKVLEEMEAVIEKADFAELEKMEGELGLGSSVSADAKKAYAGFEGRVFFSREGLPILVGKTKDENLNLTFKFARGNDLWFHVRGKPGAHVVVPLRSKKHASLETLLDAACLCVYYSGGERWGKTEVDYTQKKHVKRIKDSSEASYTQNRTLIVEVDAERMKRLKPEGG